LNPNSKDTNDKQIKRIIEVLAVAPENRTEKDIFEIMPFFKEFAFFKAKDIE